MRAFGLRMELLCVTPPHKLPFLYQYYLKTHRSILLHPLWRLAQQAELSFAYRAPAPICENYSWQQNDLHPDVGMVILACPQRQPIILLLQILTSEYMLF
jgi:hypothetical protein